MQTKPVPPAPDSLAAVAVVRDVLPLVPKPEDDCCRRVVDRTDVPDSGEASAWLVFLAALGVVEESAAGYARPRDPADADGLDADALAAGFREHVFLAGDCVDALDPRDPRTPEAVFERVRGRVPPWERSKRENWEGFWTERVERRLDWAVLLGLADRRNGGYVRA